MSSRTDQQGAGILDDEPLALEGVDNRSARNPLNASKKPAAPAISDNPSVRSAYEERETLPVTSDQKGALSIARRRKR